ncbi:MAG: DUF1549 and DUF1553 domain-containing protein [Isosphaeraceae bacterium]
MTRRIALAPLGAAILMALAARPASASDDKVVPPARERFAADTDEVPDLQRHLLPLMGRLGCNSRSCHGSFQGAGGFRLSLFGYDFKMDHDALMLKDSGRVNVEDAEASKVLAKPTLMQPHKGGKRMEVDGWAYKMLAQWIEDGAKPVDPETAPHFVRLEVTPPEIVCDRDGKVGALKVVAHWSDGAREDVTCLTRFRTNDEAVAEVDEDGVVTSKGVGDTHIVAFYDNGVVPIPVIRPVSNLIGEAYPRVPTPTRVDELALVKLRKLGIVPSDACDDAEFLRRVRIDLTGSLPPPDEVRAFLADPAPDKRARKIEELLDSPAYAAWWTTVLCDITGNNPALFAGGIQANLRTTYARQWYDWVERRVRDNMPYDEIVAGIALATSRKPGQSYDDFLQEQTSYFRKQDPADFAEHGSMPYFWMRRTVAKPEEKALAFSYAFLGVRLECAQCHKHPFDQWTQTDFKAFQDFFEPVGNGFAPDARQRANDLRKELDIPQNNQEAQKFLTKRLNAGEVIPWQEIFVNTNGRIAPLKGVKDKAARQAQRKNPRIINPKPLGGEEVELEAGQDPRKPLMDWMRNPENPYFARAFVNRVWANDFGRGIIHPADDLNLANPPSNAELLDYLAQQFIAHDFDMKWLHREILNSQTYQRSWKTNDTNVHDDKNFSHAAIRRVPAEVTLDAILMATADSDKLGKLQTTMEGRAIGPLGTNAPGRKGPSAYAAKVFGVSTRETNCDCNRSNEPNLLQAVFLQNDQETLQAIERGGWLAEQVKAIKDASKGGSPGEALDNAIRDAYLRTLSRMPSAEDLATSRAFLEGSDPSKGLRDLMWALLNTKEFITNH